MAILKSALVNETHEGNNLFENQGWEIDLIKRELRVHGSAVPIGSRAFEIIEMLVQSSGELVTKDELMRRVWPGLIVEDNTVQVHISAIRKALGLDRSMLRTVSGRGYRLLGDWVRRQGAHPIPSVAGRTRSSSHPFVTNVPVAASALIGREADVEQVCDLISAYRVVTLTGPGGIGKTVLAAEVARRLFPTIESDVYFIELVSLSDPQLVPSTVAYTLNLQLHGNVISAEAVARAISGRKVLLVLDNCEHVVDAAALMVDTIVHSCPQATIIATSRETLRVDGECIFRVGALDVPAPYPEASHNVLEDSAVQLFVARMRALRGNFDMAGQRLTAIAAICRKLDGLPLAIELAAARAATLGINEVADHLDDRFSLLTHGRRTASPRHQTLRATLDWSCELLDDTERRLLRHLSVFPAGFTLAAAVAVATGNVSSIATGISSLVSKSLVAMEGSDSGARWRLLETVRAYLLEELIDKRERDEAMRRLAEFDLALFSPFSVGSQLQDAVNDLGYYRREIDNLRAGLHWSLSPGGDPELGVHLAAAASDFWIATSLVSECCEWGQKALSHLGTAAGTRYEMVLQCSFGFALIYTQGMTGQARKALGHALVLAQKLNDFDYQQRAICGLWFHSARSMEVQDASHFAHEYELIVEAGDVHAQAIAAWLLGVPQSYSGDHAKANERLQWTIDHYPVASRRSDMIRLGGDPRASALAHRTINLLSLGSLDTASRESRTAVDEARIANQLSVHCVSLAWAAGFISLTLGETEIARVYGDELVSIAYKHGLRPFHAAGRCVQGSLEAKDGNPDIGVASLRSGLSEMQDARYLLFYPFFQTKLASVLGSIGLFDDGLTEVDAALRFALQNNYQWFVPEIVRTKGELLALRGNDEPRLIEDLFRESMTQARAHGALYWELSAAVSLGLVLQAQGRQREIIALLAPLYDCFTEGFSVPTLKAAKGLLDS